MLSWIMIIKNGKLSKLEKTFIFSCFQIQFFRLITTLTNQIYVKVKSCKVYQSFLIINHKKFWLSKKNAAKGKEEFF